MTSIDRETIIQKLRDFHLQMENYIEYCRRHLIRSASAPSVSQLREAVTKLAIESAAVKPIVETTVGRRSLSEGRFNWDPWVGAFIRDYSDGTSMRRIRGSLDAVLQSVEETIGYLESKDFIESITRPIAPKSIQRPKVFIAHDGPSDLRSRLELECWRMMLEPIVAEKQTSLDESVDSKVDRLLDGCEFAIVLARVEVAIDQDSSKIPRGNVIDEISRIRAELGDNYIILLEDGLSLPSNQSTGVVYETFEKENFGEAVLKVWKALRSKGLL